MSGMDRLTELLPCPFCGVEPCMYDDVNHSKACYISCQTEGCIGEMTWHENDAEAIAAWNRRASQAAPAPSDGLREAMEPFAKAADIRLCGEWRDDEKISQTDVPFYITFGDLRRARAALAKIAQEG